MKKTHLEMLQEMGEFMAEDFGINMIDADAMVGGLKEDTIKDSFVERMVEASDFSDLEKEDFKLFVENSINDFITEAATSPEVKPFIPFQLSMLKEIYSRRIARKLATVEVTASVNHTFARFETVVTDTDGTEYSLADITANTLTEGYKTSPLVDGTVFPMLDNANLTAEEIVVKGKGRIRVDSGLAIVSATIGGVKYPVDIPVGKDGAFNSTFRYTLAGVVTYSKMYGYMDLETGDIVFHSTVAGEVTDAEVKWRVSNDLLDINNLSLRLKYEEDASVSIGDGDIITMPLPLNYLSNVKAFTTMSGMDLAVRKLSEAYSQIDDVKTLAAMSDAAALSVNKETFTQYANAATAQGLDVVGYNREMLYRLNQIIAQIDAKNQFTGIYQYNVASNPIDAARMFSPSIDSSEPLEASVLGGAFGYNVTPVITAVGSVNLYSTKSQKAGKLIVVPKSNDKDERIVTDFVYSSRLTMGKDGYRDPKHANVPAMLVHERKKLVVFGNDSLGELTVA